MGNIGGEYILADQVVVHAEEPWKDHWLPFTNFDLLVPPFEVGSIFFYKKPSSHGTTFPAIVNTLKASLSLALSLYPPMAGQIAWNEAAGENQIHCNNQGVHFIEAVADVELKELNLYNPDECVQGKLMPTKLLRGVLAIQELKKMSLSNAAKEVQEFLHAATTKEHFLDIIDWVEEQKPRPLISKAVAGTDMSFSVSAGQRFETMDKIDFGWGKLTFGSCHLPYARKDCFVMTMGSPKNNEDWVVYMHMPKKHINYLEAHATHIINPLNADYLNI